MPLSPPRTAGPMTVLVFFFNDTATTEIYTLSLHDALPISLQGVSYSTCTSASNINQRRVLSLDRKSTRLNSSHLVISYAVFCLKKKNHQWPAGREQG